jgi:hypothetical protein
VTSEYDIEDVAGRELLLLAAQSLDRADALRTQIDQHGELITTRSSTAKFDGSNSRSVPSMSIAIYRLSDLRDLQRRCGGEHFLS